MRKFLLLLLVTSAATPAFAAPEDSNDPPNYRGPRTERSEPRADRNDPRSERGEDRPARVDRSDRPDRAATGGSDRPRFNRSNGDNPRAVFVSPGREGDGREVSRPARLEQPTPSRGLGERFVGRRAAGDSVREWRRGERTNDSSPTSIEERNLRRAPSTERGPGGLVEPRVSTPRTFDPNNGPRRISRTPQFGTEPPPPATTFNRGGQTEHRRWRTDWRRDDRYDWRDWRRHHRSNFHFGAYLDPFGWDYARYGIGWRLWPSYYSSSFWLNDTWQYRLPPAYGPYRWVRYYDDALLVNIYTGEVVDVEYNFFW